MPLVSGAFETDDKPFRRSDKRKRHPTKLAKMVDEACAYPPYNTCLVTFVSHLDNAPG